MLLICVDRAAESFDVFTESPGFAVNILSENQTETSGLFASKRIDKFDITEWNDSASGYPILDGVSAWFDCKRDQVIDAGDHVIIIGEILSYDYNDSIGLGYARGGYMSLSLERSAAKASALSTGAVVGAIVEHDGKIFLEEDVETGEVFVPASGLNGENGSLNNFQAYLDSLKLETNISSLFAVFENEESGQQSIYYRAKVDEIKGIAGFYDFNEIPWDRIQSSALTIMLKRYISESGRQRFGVYFGSDRDGSVKALSED